MTMAIDIVEPALQTTMLGDQKCEYLAPRYRLSWLDSRLHDVQAATSLEPFHRVRDFKHLGGAIAWGRRRIFHGATFGDVIELSRIVRRRFDGVYEEYSDETRDLTLAGFHAWERVRDWGGSHNAWTVCNPDKRCYWG